MDSLTVRLLIPTEDAEILEEIFKSEENPRFIIFKNIKHGAFSTEMEIYVEQSCDLLFIMKKVQRMITYENNRGKIPEIVRLEMENYKLKKELEELKNQISIGVKVNENDNKLG
jgi:hypothetical protein